jgi:proton glutamate symport protein
VKLQAPSLTVQIFIGLVLGILLGWQLPAIGMACAPGADIFLHLIKTIIAPLVFATLVVGIAGGHGSRKDRPSLWVDWA